MEFRLLCEGGSLTLDRGEFQALELLLRVFCFAPTVTWLFKMFCKNVHLVKVLCVCVCVHICKKHEEMSFERENETKTLKMGV